MSKSAALAGCNNGSSKMGDLIPLWQVLQSPGEFEGWLYLQNGPWTLETRGFFRSADLSLSPEEEKSARVAITNEGWKPIVTASEIEDILYNLEYQVDETPSMQQKLDALIFFYENDAYIELE